MTVSTKLKQI
ncbi:Protein of unknown function [Bacillus mobilis]|nr:Protein of unknown function [Bacillus mobilis]